MLEDKEIVMTVKKDVPRNFFRKVTKFVQSCHNGTQQCTHARTTSTSQEDLKAHNLTECMIPQPMNTRKRTGATIHHTQTFVR